MLTSFFSKSNPINYLIIGILLSIGYIYGGIAQTEAFLTFSSILEHLLYMVIVVFSMLLLDFVIRKNQLTKQNTFAILLFGCFFWMFPVIFTDQMAMLANLFLLLAFRRVVTLHSDRNNEKKILDAAIYITIASFFYFWSLLYFVVLFIGILRKPDTTFKQLLIPVAGFAAVFILTTTVFFLTKDSFEWFYTWKTEISFDFSTYNSVKILLPLAVLLTLILWTVVFRLLSLKAAASKEKPNYVLLLVILLITIVIALASPKKTGAELIFMLAPTAIIATNYLERIGVSATSEGEEIWFKEILLWLIVLLPIAVLFV